MSVEISPVCSISYFISVLLYHLRRDKSLHCHPKVSTFGSPSDQIRSVAQSCPTLCDPMNRSTPGLPVHHQLPAFTQTHVHWVSDAIQQSYPLSSPSSTAFNLSKHPDLYLSLLFASGGQSIGASASTSVLPVNIQGWFPLGLSGWISLQSKGLSRIFSSTTVQKHQFFGTQLYLWPSSHIHTWLLEKP